MNLRARLDRLERELPAREPTGTAACEICGRWPGSPAGLVIVTPEEMEKWRALRSCPRCDGGLIVLPDNGY
jgi:hypothetical protein